MGKCSGKTCRLISIMGLVISYFFAELIIGYTIQSLSLIADAFHMLSDLISLIVGLVATRLTKMPRTPRNTFGWQRADVVGTLINTVILSTLCFTILVRAIERFIEPHEVLKPKLMVGVGIGGLFINVVSIVILLTHGHGHNHAHNKPYDQHPIEVESLVTDGAQEQSKITDTKTDESEETVKETELEKKYVPNDHFNRSETQSVETNNDVQNTAVRKRNSVKRKKKRDNSGHNHSHGGQSMNMKAVLLHVVADAIGSVIVVVSALVLLLTPKDYKWTVYIDPGMSLIMIAIIMYSTAKLLKQSALILLQSVPKDVKVKTIEKEIESIVGCNKVHDLHIWRLQSECIIGTVHIRCKDLEDYVTSSRSVKAIFHQSDIHCTTIQPEFNEHETPQSVSTEGHCALNCGPDETCNQNTCCPTTNSSSGDTAGSANTQNPIASV